MRGPAALVLAAALLAAGCGGSDEQAASTPAPTRTATPTAFAPSAPAPSENGPEAEPGGAGDEEPLRQRVNLVIGDGGITPRLAKVSGFLAVELVVRNDTAEEQVLTVLNARPRRAVSVGPGETGRLRYAGLRRGRYVVEGYAAGRATLVSSIDEP